MSQHASDDSRDALKRRHGAEHRIEGELGAPREPAVVVLGDHPALEGGPEQAERDAAQDSAHYQDGERVETHGDGGHRVDAAEDQARASSAESVGQVAREEGRHRRRHVRADVERRHRGLVERLLVPEERVHERVLEPFGPDD